MKRIIVVVAFVAIGSCNFAAKHPAVTAGIVAGSVAMTIMMTMRRYVHLAPEIAREAVLL